MTHRAVTLSVHAILALLLLVVSGWLVWITVSYVPDPVDPWPVGPGLIAIPMAALLLLGAAAVVWGVATWMQTGDRRAALVGDVAAALGLLLLGGAMPPELALAVLVVFLVAGATIAAAPHRT